MIRNGPRAVDPGANPSDDICPVCKSNRYLNPSLEFLINPECYHKMCSTCVDRIFTSGPASCPVPYCGKTLRKRGFHKAFFADLKVEREVDIRKRVGAVFNRRQDDFETLLDWNNYLEEVESLIFDLVEGSRDEKVKAEERLRAYMEGNKGEIELNRKAGLEELEVARRREKADKEAIRMRRLAALREDEESKLDLQKSQLDVLDQLANSNGDATEIAQNAQKVILKRSSARRNFADPGAGDKVSGASTDGGLTIRGLKKKVAPVAEMPYDPFGGLTLDATRYVLQNDYDSEWLASAKSDMRQMAGGYSMQEYYARTIFEAFSGLGLFLMDEAPDPERHSSIPLHENLGAAEVSIATSKLGTKMDIDDDVF